MIEQTAAQLQEKEKLLAEKERKLESERKRAEQEQGARENLSIPGIFNKIVVYL